MEVHDNNDIVTTHIAPFGIGNINGLHKIRPLVGDLISTCNIVVIESDAEKI